MRDFINDVCVPFAIMIFGLGLVIGVVVGAVATFEARSCAVYTEETGTPTKYRWFDECYIQTAQGSMPWSEFKARAFTRETPKSE